MNLLESYEAKNLVFGVVNGRFNIANAPKSLRAELLASADALRLAWLRREWQRYLAERPLPTDDPRPDLAVDHGRWAAVLPLAHGHSQELFEVLHGLRCLGACIVNGKLGCGEMTAEEYGGYRALLMPHAALLAGVLRGAQ